MRILMAHWLMRRAGAQSVMSMLSEHFRAGGHQVDFVTTVERGPNAAEFAAHCDELWHCGDSAEIPVADYLSEFQDGILRRNYEVFVTHHSHQGVAVAGLLPTRIATVSIIHEHPVMGAGFVGLSNPDAFDAYVGVSRGVASAVREIVGPDRRVTCILNGVRCGVCSERPPRADMRGLFVGRLTEQKGVLYLPQIVRAARRRGVPLQLTVLGDGEERAVLLREMRAQEVEPWIRILGNVPQREVFAHMEEADILLVTSRHEGLSLVIPEAMSRGCIPIATYLKESTAEIVTPRLDGFLVQSVTAFAEAIETLYRQPGFLREMRKSARHTASTRFSDRRMAEEYEALFTELLTLPQSRRRIQNCPSFV
ncbi:MAG TPA: glycosyltransferase family 4 protein [Fimbriimonadaceae bacterium]|nr:glycosyltransferase family 4 protein [Fimbriimonadaceae bacterium]